MFYFWDAQDVQSYGLEADIFKAGQYTAGHLKSKSQSNSEPTILTALPKLPEWALAAQTELLRLLFCIFQVELIRHKHKYRFLHRFNSKNIIIFIKAKPF